VAGGPYTISATLSPAAVLGNYTITANTALFTINSAPSSTTFTSSLNPSVFGTSVTFTATVSSIGGTPSGTVTFNDGSTILGQASLVSGQSAFSASALAQGAHSIVAVYGGDANFESSTSSAISQTVNRAPAITSANSATFTLGAPSSFTVTATGFPPPTLSQSGALPTGVTFDQTTGVLSGIPSASGSFPITITADNGVGADAVQSFTLTVAPTTSIAFVSSTNCSQNTESTGVACTLVGSSTTTNNDVIVGLSWKTPANSIEQVVGDAPGSPFVVYSQQRNDRESASAILVCRHCPSLTSVTPTFSGPTLYELNVAEYSGVTWIGITGLNTHTGTSPGLTFMTGDANDWIVVETSSLGNAGIPTGNIGNLRQANRTGVADTDVAGALIDNTVADAGAVTANATITSGKWSAAGVELRTTAPRTYIWPDCDSTHPCVIYHYNRPAIPLEAIGPLFKFWVKPSQANNLLKLTITHPGTIDSITDAGGNTWESGASAIGASYTTEIRYACGAPANSGGEIDIMLSAPILIGDIMHVSYEEISGIATSACSDGTSSATELSAGPMQPGSITTTGDGDLIYTFGIDGTAGQTDGFPSGHFMPDDVSAELWDSMFENFMSTVSVQTTHGAINPTLYVSAMDVNDEDTWQLVAQAFKASNGAGTQPPSGKAWVVRDIIGWNNPLAAVSFMAAPTSGNVIVFDTPHFVSIVDLSTLTDNLGTTYTSNPGPDAYGDPQQYVACIGNATVQRDRVFAFTSGSSSTLLQYYDISGAKESGGSTGCIGAEANDITGMQNPVDNANIVTSAFATPFTFSPGLNSTAYSVVIFTMGFGAGPPSGPCNTGGITPPSCTNDMSDFVFGSVWSTGMGDSSHYTTGDVFGYYTTNSTVGKSFDFLMANSVDQPGGGSGANPAAVEILGEPAAGDSTTLPHNQ